MLVITLVLLFISDDLLLLESEDWMESNLCGVSMALNRFMELIRMLRLRVNWW